MPKLYVVSTPIGNLKDITIRAIEVLRESELLIVEDKRRTVILLNEYGIGRKEMIPIAERTPRKRLERIIERIKSVNISSLVSDSGTPVISDPGKEIVRMCWEEKIELDVVPGPSAPISAIALSGFSGSKFTFLGFLPKGRKRRRLLKDIASRRETIVFFESPHRLAETLEEMKEILGDRDILIAREMTKIHQELFRGKISQAVEHFKGEVLGEITIVVSGREG